MDLAVLKQTAAISDQITKGEIKGVALIFHGLGGMYPPEYNAEELAWAENGWLLVFPFYGPWSWMNRQARRFVDEVVESVYLHYHLSDDIPLVSTGGSMGGMSALLYCRYGKKAPIACYAKYPVCDTKYHFSEREDLPRSMRSAFYGYQEDFDAVLEEHSPVCQIEYMPHIPYLILHGFDDKAVSKANHSDVLCKEMKEQGFEVSYTELENFGHGGTLPPDVLQNGIDFICDLLPH